VPKARRALKQMRRAVGVTTAEHIATGLVEGQHLAGPLRVYKEESAADSLASMPPAEIAACMVREIHVVDPHREARAVGVALPGIIRCGVVEESPNLHQLKGAHMQDLISKALQEAGILAPVAVFNDADVMAAGLAATRGLLDQQIRAWTLGMASDSEFIPGERAFGRAATLSFRSIRESATAAAGELGTWKA